MLALAIDTAIEPAVVGVVDLAAEKTRSERIWEGGRRHTRELAPTVREVLSEADTDLEVLSLIAVARGPGSYTGVRTGVSVAKGLALALGSAIPLCGVATTSILLHKAYVAVPRKPGTTRLLAALPAGRNRWIWGWLDPNEPWRELEVSDLVNGSLDQLVQAVSRGSAMDWQPWLCADRNADLEHGLAGLPGLCWPGRRERLRTSLTLALLARNRLAANERSDPESVVPVYFSSAEAVGT